MNGAARIKPAAVVTKIRDTIACPMWYSFSMYGMIAPVAAACQHSRTLRRARDPKLPPVKGAKAAAERPTDMQLSAHSG